MKTESKGFKDARGFICEWLRSVRVDLAQRHVLCHHDL